MKRLLLCFVTAISLQGLAACTTQGIGSASADRHNMTSSESLLSDYHWLTQADWNDATPYPVKLDFQDQRVSASGLCNNISASYVIQGQKMTIVQAASTMRMCSDPALMDYEQNVARQLEQVSTWAISSNSKQTNLTLSLNLKDGSQWLLKGDQTHEAKYGDGVTVFLEVQPQMFACKHPLGADKSCLKVRTLTYDDSGVKQNAGEWHLFYNDIEGYEHEAGVRNVLRVKHYSDSQATTDTSRHVYVLDMLVESQRMP